MQQSSSPVSSPATAPTVPTVSTSPIVQTTAIPAGAPQTIPPVMPPSSVTPTSSPQLPASSTENRYAYEQCTIQLVVQFRPARENGGPRPVLVSVQNGVGNQEDLPLYRLFSSEEELGGAWPPAVATLLEALRQDLPVRQTRHSQRTTPKPATPSSSSAQRNATGSAKKTAPTLPSPPGTTTTPKPVSDASIVFGGLFDNLD